MTALQDHFSMLDGDFVPVAGRFVLVQEVEHDLAYVTSWDTFEDARSAAFPLEPGFKLIDDKTKIYWTSEGMFQ